MSDTEHSSTTSVPSLSACTLTTLVGCSRKTAAERPCNLFITVNAPSADKLSKEFPKLFHRRVLKKKCANIPKVNFSFLFSKLIHSATFCGFTLKLVDIYREFLIFHQP